MQGTYFWNTYPFLRFTISLILGIICYDEYPAAWSWPIHTLVSLISGYFFLIFISHKNMFYQLRYLNGALALAILFFIGGCLSKFYYHSPAPSHYSNLQQHIRGFSGVITSPVNERSNHFRYDFELENVFTTADSTFHTSGQIHLYVRKDSLASPFHYGDRLTVYGRFYPVPGPGNPNEFNYKKYLERQHIYSHAFVKWDEVRMDENDPPNPMMKWAFALRTSAADIIDKYINAPRENGIAKALLLGIKDHLDNDVKEAYSAAGAMHVLAVSGLHVGIIYLLINLIFGKLKEAGKWSRYLFGCIGVLTIWLYATVTGLSPSVLRAATMFSLVAISQASAREGNIYNTLAFAAFVLLLFDPYLIYAVGFQLSFAAVAGIVYLQPTFYRLLDFKSWLLDKAWAITCVSIAAQLSTFPLCAYYFHQFPTYFLASNLIVIPASFLMLVGGVSMLIIDPIIPSVGAWIGNALNQFMWLINEIISYVHVLPNSLIEWIYMDQFGLVLTYLIVFTFIAGLHYGSFKTLMVSALLGLTFIGWALISHEEQAIREELIFYEISNKLAIDHISGHQALLYIDGFKDQELELLSFQIDPHRLSSHLKPIKESLITFEEASFQKKDAIQLGHIAGKRFLIFDSTTFHLDFKETIETDFIIINNQAVKSLAWLADHFSFEQLVISDKNSHYYSRKMKEDAERLGLAIHSLKEDGALTIPMKKVHKKRADMLPALFTTNPD